MLWHLESPVWPLISSAFRCVPSKYACQRLGGTDKRYNYVSFKRWLSHLKIKKEFYLSWTDDSSLAYTSSAGRSVLRGYNHTKFYVLNEAGKKYRTILGHISICVKYTVPKKGSGLMYILVPKRIKGKINILNYFSMTRKFLADCISWGGLNRN